ncbi:uncharacterized protein M421DRAFT_419838 [Didymella exigua CBS 183.55]|uniref:Uncharacterized protein n=1 Tax=Didymella exigua CBS 183.55 TaxID=1150837 RepID=A0A6A5RLL8_9PLEO|nr:uncharacterized protein M421DRAFT_419838 [Didymella exigua CBS 183.55]KAF1929315.1 hypothetical protein M421DRAFT_419838 [Didymella exigua CBS 183.55]
MGAVVSCIKSVFRTIGNCIMAIVNAIAAGLKAIINAIVSLFGIIISCLTCGKLSRQHLRFCANIVKGRGGGRKTRTTHTSRV